MASPDDNLAAAIDTGTSLTLGTDLFTGPVRASDSYIPKRAVFVMIMPGGEIMNYCNGGAASPELYSPSCRVVVRSDVGNYNDGRDLARTIRGVIHDVPPTGYISCRVRSAEPEYYGRDDDGAHLFGIDVDMLYSA